VYLRVRYLRILVVQGAWFVEFRSCPGHARFGFPKPGGRGLDRRGRFLTLPWTKPPPRHAIG